MLMTFLLHFLTNDCSHEFGQVFRVIAGAAERRIYRARHGAEHGGVTLELAAGCAAN
jgi:hypothetical protein